MIFAVVLLFFNIFSGKNLKMLWVCTISVSQCALFVQMRHRFFLLLQIMFRFVLFARQLRHYVRPAQLQPIYLVVVFSYSTYALNNYLEQGCWKLLITWSCFQRLGKNCRIMQGTIPSHLIWNLLCFIFAKCSESSLCLNVVEFEYLLSFWSFLTYLSQISFVGLF